MKRREHEMETLIRRMQALSSAEDFLAFFGVPYDDRVVKVNRLHILKRFQQYLGQADAPAPQPPAEPDDVALFRRYREQLARAYQDFVQSNAQREKVFKVFQTADGSQHVPLASLREGLAARRSSAA